VPTYEYVCRKCGEHVEVVQSFKDEPLSVCSACGGQLRKVFGSIGIAFKGSGFYRTDSRTSSEKSSSSASSKESSTSSTSASAATA
jgi:putative FmdB family regulatory protein